MPNAMPPTEITAAEIADLLTELEAAHAASTQGEWMPSVGSTHLLSRLGNEFVSTGICKFESIHGLYRDYIANGTWIAKAHNAFPKLLAALRSLGAERDALRVSVGNYKSCHQQLNADSMIAHRWFEKVFGEQMNGRDFSIKCPMADRLLPARDARMKAEGAAEVWDIVAERSRLVKDMSGEVYAESEAARLREGR